jgi:hypothetical protein
MLEIIYNFDYFYYCLFFLVSFGIYSSYPTVHFLLCKSEKYRSYEIKKQYYIIKNLIKTICMAIIFVFMILTFIPNLLNDVWVDSYNRLIGVFYVSNDLAGLFAVPNLPKSTKLHHYTTVFLFTVICAISTEKEVNIGHLIAVYTIFSCIPYLVNSYLALRFFYNREVEGVKLDAKQIRDNQIIDYNRIAAYYLYLGSCICNWTYQAIFLFNRIRLFEMDLAYTVYYLVLIPIINDDIVLLKWLYNKNLDL